MFIDKIILKDIRGFEKLEFSLDRGGGKYAGWTVFTGSNGSGKSTLLKAIAIALVGRDGARALQPSFHRWVRDGAHEGSIELQLVREPRDDQFVKKGRASDAKFSSTLRLVNGSREPSIEASVSPAERSIWAQEAKGWFSCGYGPFRRVFGASPEATRQMVAPVSERFVTMFHEAASLAEVDQWLRHLSHRKLEDKHEEAEQLELLVDMLNDDLLPGGIRVADVNSDGLWLRDRKGVRLGWPEMSDGYRSAVALLADILRHLMKTFGAAGLTERDENGKLAVVRSGVVLVDEIDSHLHPEWQRQVGFWLKRHFPNVQFLVTSHSPIVLQAADRNGLFVLPPPGSAESPRPVSESDRDRIVAARPDTILLSEAFGLENTRSPVAVENQARYAKLEAKRRGGGALTSAEQAEAKRLRAFAEVASSEEP